MKKLIYLSCGLVVTLVFIDVASVIRDVGRMAWMQNAELNIHGIAVIIESFSDEHGNYPPSLSTAIEESDSPSKNEVAQLLGCHGGHYEYQATTNGFIVAVVKPAGVLRRELKLSKTFVKGKVYGDLPVRPNPKTQPDQK